MTDPFRFIMGGLVAFLASLLVYAVSASAVVKVSEILVVTVVTFISIR